MSIALALSPATSVIGSINPTGTGARLGTGTTVISMVWKAVSPSESCAVTIMVVTPSAIG